MVFFTHGAFGWANGLSVMATVKTATSRMVQAGFFIDYIFPHLKLPDSDEFRHILDQRCTFHIKDLSGS
jgi:cyclopropane fatty-acyl-phospholipid synthase-like methyltransferase